MTEWWERLSARARRWVVAVVAILGVLVIIGGLNSFGASPSGPSLSSYATTDSGLAAYASLLDATGHPIDRLREPLDEAALPTTSTLITLGQVPSGGEQRALRAFLDGGGRLITGGPEAERFLRTFANGLSWGGGAEERARVVAAPTVVSNVRTLVGEGFGAWRDAPGVALARSGERVAVFELAVGKGSIVAIADPSILTNAFLDRADNAGFGVAIADDPARPVSFAENGHGFGAASGLSAIPARWKTALWFAGFAGLVGAIAAGKRFGPIDAEPEAPAPERVQFVSAVASTLSRSRDRDAAVAPLRARAQAQIARRGGVLADATDDLLAAAQRAGLTADEARIVAGSVSTDDDLVALGRVVSRLEEH